MRNNKDDPVWPMLATLAIPLVIAIITSLFV